LESLINGLNNFISSNLVNLMNTCTTENEVLDVGETPGFEMFDASAQVSTVVTSPHGPLITPPAPRNI
jgi:hypothetical protein